jgi:4-diphosphocytidyl-2-C-methyl-D-erythritol kinase
MPPTVESIAPAGHAQTLTCPAPGKLNLFLLITGRRPDGYHTLQTLFRFIDFGDTLMFRARDDGEIVRSDPLADVPTETDLTVRAARLLQQESGCRLGVDIELTKRLPIGGGLGGGSSDAASTLLALNRLWDLGLSRSRLQELALRLGADVPIFVFGRNALAEGIGEQLHAVDLPPAWYLILVPPVHVSTAAVFADRELTPTPSPVTIRAFSERCVLDWAPFAGLLGRNDLERVVCRRADEVAHHLNWLRSFGPAALTGSGASVFCPFESEAIAQAVLRQVPESMRGFVAAGLPRHPLYDWAE